MYRESHLRASRAFSCLRQSAVFANYLFISAAYDYDFIWGADAISSSIVTVTKFSNLIGYLITRRQFSMVCTPFQQTAIHFSLADWSRARDHCGSCRELMVDNSRGHRNDVMMMQFVFLFLAIFREISPEMDVKTPRCYCKKYKSTTLPLST